MALIVLALLGITTGSFEVTHRLAARGQSLVRVATTSPSGAITYDVKSACIYGRKYLGNVLPAKVGEFETDGLNTTYWGGDHVKTTPPGLKWAGYKPDYGLFQPDSDTIWGQPSDGYGTFPLTIANDSAVSPSRRGLRISVQPLAEYPHYNPEMFQDHLYAISATAAGAVLPTDGGSLTLRVSTARPPGVSIGDRIGTGYYRFHKGPAWNGKLSSGLGSNTWTLTDVHTYYASSPGAEIPQGTSLFKYYDGVDYYAGALVTNIDLQYGFFVARLRLPPYLPGLWPAFWMQADFGEPAAPNGQREDFELDVMEMLGIYGNTMNQQSHQYSTGHNGANKDWPSSGLFTWTASKSPQAAYHDYGVLLVPGSETYFVDGKPVNESHKDGPDWTQGAADKMVMLMFQIGKPGSYLDPRGAAYSGNPWPQYLWAQWIRIYAATNNKC
jgi:hypothetical protein